MKDEDIEVEERYRTWIDTAAFECGMDICAMDVLHVKDTGEEYIDLNNNKIWDEGESHIDKRRYYYPLFKKIFKNSDYEATFFNQEYIKGKKRYGKPHYRLLKKTFKNIL